MTLYSTNSWGLDISDHHDVTEEDMLTASYGDDFWFWGGDRLLWPPRVSRRASAAEFAEFVQKEGDSK